MSGNASTSVGKGRRYPPRLYPEGKSPLLRKSMHHNCTLASFGFMKECIGEDVYNDIRDHSQVGVVLMLADSDYVWWGKLIHYILTRQLAIERKYDIWALIEGSPIRFSLHEYEDITGLNCAPFVDDDIVEADHRDFWAELDVEGAVGPNWYDLEKALKSCRTWSAEKRKMLGLLFVVHVGILGIARSSRIPLDYAKTVLDSGVFERFPWGRIGFKELIQSIKVVSYENDSYAIHGLVHVLMIWALESLHKLGKKYGNKKKTDEDEAHADDVVPLLEWSGGRPRIDIGEFFATEKRINKKLSVTNVGWRSEEDIYPFWPDEQGLYPEGSVGIKLLDNLVADIFLGRVDSTQWELGKEKVVGEKMKEKMKEKRKEKRKEIVQSDDTLDPPPKKPKTSFKRARGPVKLKDVSDDSGEENEPSKKEEEEVSMGVVMKLLLSMSGKMDYMNSNFGVQLNLLGTHVKEIEKKVTALEGDVGQLKKPDDTTASKKGKEVKNGTSVKIGPGANDEESKTDDAGGSGPNEET
ncbi:uncharacterized protein LOC17893586 [Capsella rubella]|uniref:uncharacterized protein LOC17893586 n=1 Tax=Capsella rubella TaxID=81985 RepID=UPI000CD5B39C|nr:uncharacterized protein LOC17893586 [Capsella rubella]